MKSYIIPGGKKINENLVGVTSEQRKGLPNELELEGNECSTLKDSAINLSLFVLLLV